MAFIDGLSVIRNNVDIYLGRKARHESITRSISKLDGAAQRGCRQHPVRMGFAAARAVIHAGTQDRILVKVKAGVPRIIL